MTEQIQIPEPATTRKAWKETDVGSVLCVQLSALFFLAR